MAQQASQILSAVFVLTLAVLPTFGQSLSAKVNALQPQPAAISGDSDRVRDGLVGPVRRVRTELVKVSNSGARVVEETKRILLETAEYDPKGNKTQNQYFPIAGSRLTGREVYKYDDKGNISEMTLLASDGTLIGKETYKYEFDSVGNWTRMTTAVAVVEDGKITFEPTELTYRTIFYYLDEKMARMLEPAQPAPSSSAPERTDRNEVKVQPVGSGPVNVIGDEKPKPSDSSTSRQDNASKTGAAQLPSLIALDRSKIALSQPVPPEAEAHGVNSKPLVVLEDEPPASPAPKTNLKSVSRGVLNGSAIQLPAPAYPDIARRMRASGVVVVEVVIDENGKVISANAVSGPGILREVAVQAAHRARFSPTKLSGQPVRITGTINYNFTLIQ
jgi:TonB family protein